MHPKPRLAKLSPTLPFPTLSYPTLACPNLPYTTPAPPNPWVAHSTLPQRNYPPFFMFMLIEFMLPYALIFWNQEVSINVLSISILVWPWSVTIILQLFFLVFDFIMNLFRWYVAGICLSIDVLTCWVSCKGDTLCWLIFNSTMYNRALSNPPSGPLPGSAISLVSLPMNLVNICLSLR